MRRYILRALLRWLYRSYLEGVVIELPKLEENIEKRNSVVNAAKQLAQNDAHKYIRDTVLEISMRTTAFKAKDDMEIAFNRGIAHGIQLYEKRLIELYEVNVTTEKDNA